MKFSFIPLYIYLFLLISCKPANTPLYEAEEKLQTNPDSALLILEDIQDNYPHMGDKEKALFGLLYFKACDKESVEISSTELIDFSIDYYKEKKDRLRLADSYLYKGRHYGYKRKYAESILYALEAIDLADPAKDHNLLGKAYFGLAMTAIYQEESEKALEHINKSIYHFEKDGDTENFAKMYMVASWAYQQTDRYDEAIQASLKAFELTTDSIVKGDVYNDIAMIYSHQEKYDSTLYYSRKSLPYPYYDTNQSLRYYHLASAFFYLDHNDSAIIYANKAFEYPIDIYIESEAYRLLANTYYDNGDNENFNTYLLKYHACQDSIAKLEKQPNINLVEEIHYSQVEKERIKGHRFVLTLIIIVVLIAAILGIYWLLKRNSRKETEVTTYKAELEKKHDLLLTEVMDEIQQLKDKYAPQRKKAKFEERTEIDKKVYSESLYIDNEEKFVDKMNKKLNFLPDKLRKQYPEISYKEILWCCLFVLKVPTTEISMLLDYTQNSQYKFKQRLVKKLGLSSTKDLEELLNNLLQETIHIER